MQIQVKTLLFTSNIKVNIKISRTLTRDMVVCARWAGILETADLLGFSYTTVTRVFPEMCEK